MIITTDGGRFIFIAFGEICVDGYGMMSVDIKTTILFYMCLIHLSFLEGGLGNFTTG
ncbi:hypothetical protein ANCCAN_18747 [Ancylostoma caninum]|uniref:Uncharacterized protein n=1 Tax=Ancylostoma caninum TaxID=29170 RepID=A0A368FX55_ANCCA|nr:hypothetical protein ANCCAN_18747 [Ancylostoma caninum]